ncbi:MAG: type III polyketide synthase [Hyphomicrobiaceae bacterium]
MSETLVRPRSRAARRPSRKATIERSGAECDVVIAGVATAVPGHVIAQDDFLERTLELAPEFSSFRQLFGNTGISKRHAAVPLDWIMHQHGWVERNEVFRKAAPRLVEEVARDLMAKTGIDAEDIDAVVVACTTGIAVPSLDAGLANRLGLRPDVERLPLFGLGCAGGVTGLARAANLARARPGRNVLFVTVELCTINGRVRDRRMANFISAALFGDGAAGVMLRSLSPGESPGNSPLLGETGEYMWPESEAVMGWSIEEDGFGVVISPEIPRFARDRLGPALDEFLARAGLRLSDLDGIVLHPGGRKVLEAAEIALDLPRIAFRHSWEVLGDFGNMSSPTVLFVLAQTMRERPSGRHLMAAFGPGFTVSLALVDFG